MMKREKIVTSLENIILFVVLKTEDGWVEDVGGGGGERGVSGRT